MSKKAAQVQRYESSVGFPDSLLPEKTVTDFKAYCKKYLPKPTEDVLFEGKTTDMKFNFFLTVYRLSLMWAHVYFKPQKEEFAKKRRALLDMKTDDPQVR